MKGGTAYARQLKRFHQRLLRQFGKVEETIDPSPVEQLILAILARNTSDARARTAFQRMREVVVDYNDLRVTPAIELAETIGNEVPDALAKAQAITDALNRIYDKRNTVDLSHLKSESIRDARARVAALPGCDDFVAAWVVLRSLGGHAIPVDDATMRILNDEGLVDGRATIDEVRAFLERNIMAADALVFTTLMRRHVAARAPRAGETARRTQRAPGDKRRKAAADAPASGMTAPAAGERPRRKSARDGKRRPVRSASRTAAGTRSRRASTKRTSRRGAGGS